MKTRDLHSWQVTPSEAVAIQRPLADKVIKNNTLTRAPHFIGGADISVKRSHDPATAAVVVLEYPGLKLVDFSVVHEPVTFPYVPGLLSFRESPLVLHACEKLTTEFDLLLVDGQGIAHPRRVGLASHLGLLLDKPAIGCAKSRLIGESTEPETAPGSWTEITDDGEIIGAVLRTRRNVRPVYVSIGHKVDLETCIRWVMACGKGYRIPEPLRLAHMVAGGSEILSTNI